MPRHDQAILTMNSAIMVYRSAIFLARSKMPSVLDEKGEKPKPGEGPNETMGSAILFAVAIELALNCMKMEEAKERSYRRKKSRIANKERHDLSKIFSTLDQKNKKLISEQVAARGWKIDPILAFHKSMVSDWRYFANRANDGGLFHWGDEPLSAVFKGIVAAWQEKYPKPPPEPMLGTEEFEAFKKEFFRKRDEVKKRRESARIGPQ